MRPLLQFDEVMETGRMFPGLPAPRGRGNTGIIPPWMRGGGIRPGGGSGVMRVPFETGSHAASPSGLGLLHSIQALFGGGNAAQPVSHLKRVGSLPNVPRHHRLAGLLAFHLGGVTPISFQNRPQATPGLADDVPDFSMDSLPDVPSLPTMTPIVPLPLPTPTPVASPSAVSSSFSGGFGSVLGSILGTAMGVGTQYELGRLQSNLMSKQYSPSNTAAAIQAYGNQNAVLQAQSEAERQQRELDFERQAGTRSGGVVSTGFILAAAVGLVAFVAMRRPRAEKA